VSNYREALLTPLSIENQQTLFASSMLRIEKVCCLRAQRGLSCEECKTEHQIAIPLSGVNVREVNGRSYTISPLHATLSNRGEAYRVGHPYGSGETQLNIVLDEALLLELLCSRDPEAEDRHEQPFAERQLPITSALHLAAQMLMIATKSPAHTHLELEETCIDLVTQVLRGNAKRTTLQKDASRDQELAQQAQAMLASSYAESITLSGVAHNLGTSVYHLCRTFKRTTQTTLWSHVQKLRARAALTQLANGASDLTTLGLALGYSHHSHFTAAFRREVGLTPSAARRIIASGSLAKARDLLTH
jgi:AraC-like DNA-binding protein